VCFLSVGCLGQLAGGGIGGLGAGLLGGRNGCERSVAEFANEAAG